MKLKGYANGGMIYTPFISSRGIPQQTSTETTTSNKSISKAEEPGYWDKEFLKVAEQNALPSDYAAGYAELMEIAQRSQTLSETTLFGGTKESMTMGDVLKARLIANKWKAGRDAYDKASQNVTTEKAWNEAALTSAGNIYVYTDKGITTVTPEEFAKNQEKYMNNYLTNSALLAHRHDDIAYHDKWSIDVGGAIGLQTIHKQLLDTIKEFSAETISEYTKRTGNYVTQSAWRGMKILLGEGPDGYYKVNTKTELTDVNAAVKYLWDSLGEDGQSKLKAQAAIKGGNPNKAEDRYSLILSMLEMHTDYTQDVNFEKGASEYDSKDSNDTKGSSEVTDTLAEKYTSGSGAPPPRYEILMTSKSGVPMYAFTQDLGPILNADGKSAKGNANLEDVLTNGYGLTTVDKRSITFGDQLIDWADANKIVYDASTNLKRVYLPATKINGRIMPDFEMYVKITELNESVKDQGLNDDQIAKLVESTYPNLTYNRNTGLIEARNTQLFFTFGAIASTDTYGKDIKNSNWRVEQSDEVDRSWQNIYNRLIGYSTNSSTAEGTKTGNKETGNGFMPWNWGYKFYKGNIFIPVLEPMLASTIYNDQYWPKEDYRYMTQKAEAQVRQQVRESASNIRTEF